MTALVVGPLLRYAGSTEATVWVETDARCEVEILGHRARTFEVEGHHYALVLIEGLEPGTMTPYEVRLDGERVWPLDDGRPPSVIRTRHHERRARLAFGSCRVGAPERPPYTLAHSEHPEGLEIDALWAFSRRIQAGREPRPDCLLLLGDQVYADEVSPETLAFIRARRDTSKPPGDEVLDFEEYTRLYRESWDDADIRWLLATVPSTMILDDHDVHDDWNISDAWVREMRAQPWWDERAEGAFMSYWLYQHLGNLAPTELAREPLYRRLLDGADGGDALRRFAREAERNPESSQFAFHRDFGRTRLVVVDARTSRVLREGGRDLVNPAEWRWIVDHTRGDYDHLLIASTVPVFQQLAVHELEGLSEAVAGGAWGAWPARLAERLRRSLDLDHWAAFQRSFDEMLALLGQLGRDRPHGGEPPATITLLGGDVHTAYVAEVELDGGQRTRIHQVVCSPFRNPLESGRRRLIRAMGSRLAARAVRPFARLAGVQAPAARWRFVAGPTFDNSIAVLTLNELAADVMISRSGPEDGEGPVLTIAHMRVLSPG
jgi:hypothetical protein